MLIPTDADTGIAWVGVRVFCGWKGWLSADSHVLFADMGHPGLFLLLKSAASRNPRWNGAVTSRDWRYGIELEE